MSESAMWKKLREEMDGHGMFLRVENMLFDGTPDVFYTLEHAAGFIELKVCDMANKLDLKHFTTAQKVMLRMWYKAGGFAWFFLRAGKGQNAEYFLVDGLTASTLEPRVAIQDLRKKSAGNWSGFPAFNELKKMLTERI